MMGRLFDGVKTAAASVVLVALLFWGVTHGGGRATTYRYEWVPDVPVVNTALSASEAVLFVFLVYIALTMVADRVRG